MQRDGRSDFFIETHQVSYDEVNIIISRIVKQNHMSQFVELSIVLCHISHLFHILQLHQLIGILIVVIMSKHQSA